MNSTRIHGKVLKKLDDRNSVLYYVLKQIQKSKLIEKIVVATSELEIDDAIVKVAKKMNVEVYRGSPTDVLDRHYQCAKKYSFKTIVRITSDNPVVDPEIIDLAIKKYQEGQFDMVTTCNKRSYPYGVSVEVFSFESLKESWNNSSLPSEREHVILYIQNKKNNFKIYNLINEKDLTYINCTIDNELDYKLVKKVVFEIKTRPILMKDLIELFDKKPELLEINKNSDPYEGHKNSFKKDLLLK